MELVGWGADCPGDLDRDIDPSTAGTGEPRTIATGETRVVVATATRAQGMQTRVSGQDRPGISSFPHLD